MSKPDWKDAPKWATVLLRSVHDSKIYCFAEEYEAGSTFLRSDLIRCDLLIPSCWEVVEYRPQDIKTLTLTDEEAYMLACIMGYVRYTPKVRALLDKVDSLMDRELDCADYARVSVQLDIQKSQVVETTIEFN